MLRILENEDANTFCVGQSFTNNRVKEKIVTKCIATFTFTTKNLVLSFLGFERASPPPPLTHGNRERVFSRVSDSTRGVIAGECLHITEHNR